MRSLLTLIFILYLFDCNIALSQDHTNYQIQEIKKDHDWYIIIATRNDSLFKIVSQKVEILTHDSVKIQIDKYYNLELHSIIPIIDGVKMWPINYLDFDGLILDDKTTLNIDPEKGIFDLYSASNLKGLYLIEH
jgi:Ser-tRNA(Ala) deacylase AlaX